MKVVDSRTLHDENDMDFLMLLALLDPKVGFSRLSESNDGAVVIHDKNGNSGELHADDYHLEI
ncbi:hypothetical protein [Pseudoalteromonas galatheae]|uniref:hypothetical protein n=1 Tax=Pseudoalteromonas galatheae TaxID=579562 RepID=UPI0030D4431D